MGIVEEPDAPQPHTYAETAAHIEEISQEEDPEDQPQYIYTAETMKRERQDIKEWYDGVVEVYQQIASKEAAAHATTLKEMATMKQEYEAELECLEKKGVSRSGEAPKVTQLLRHIWGRQRKLDPARAQA